MWKLAETQSKFSFLLLAMLAIPTMCEMRTLLHLWLGQIPDYTVLFACMFIAMQTFDQLSQGLGLANKAIGNIGKYTFVTYTPKLFILPVGYIILEYFETPLIIIALLNIFIEIICMLLRIYLSLKTNKDLLNTKNLLFFFQQSLLSYNCVSNSPF